MLRRQAALTALADPVAAKGEKIYKALFVIAVMVTVVQALQPVQTSQVSTRASPRTN